MKNILCVGVAGLVIAMAACNSSPDNVKTAEKANDQKTDSLSNKQSVTDSSNAVASKQDADFMVKATSGSQFEVVMGKLAESNGASAGVKRFGEMMVRDHSRGEETFRGLAASKQIILPDTISNAMKMERDDMQKKRGKEFDKAYIKMMIDDHKEDISEFQKAAMNANDPDIRALAAANIPILQQHLDSVQNLTMLVK